MKKILLGLFSLFLVANANAQGGIEIRLDSADIDGTHITLANPGADVTGTIVDFPFTTAGTNLTVHFVVTNNTGSNQKWKITRVQQMVPPASWSDQVCWPPLCYPATGITFSTPNSGGSPAPTVVDGADTTAIVLPAYTTSYLAEIKPIISMGTAASALYMYYVTDVTTGAYIDSVGLRVDYLVGVEENAALSVNISPNPASEYVNINTSGVNSASVKIVDVLGNVVLKETVMQASKKIDVARFHNGIYFVIVEAEGAKTITRKVIVRH
jgi:Secretion system C-terminal sorting domain